jgi:hypothetical protein
MCITRQQHSPASWQSINRMRAGHSRRKASLSRINIVSAAQCECGDGLQTEAYLYGHVYQWLRRGFGLVIGVVNNLQPVTTINYYTIADLHTTKHSTLISSVYLH